MELRDYKEILKIIKRELRILPDGRMVKKGGTFYHAVNGKEIGITKNQELIQKLCRKKQLLTYKKQLEHNIAILSRHFTKLDTTTQEEMIRSYSKTYQGLPDHYFLHSTSIVEWLAEPYEKNPFPIKKGEGYTSEDGVTFRTKSEYMISIVLKRLNIPYRYEAAIHLGNQTKYPDFTIKHPRTGELIIWEHFGLLNEPGYVQKMIDKIKLYMKHGFVPFKTFIITFETDIGDTRHLENLVKNIILED